jgi:hypothetical protein
VPVYVVSVWEETERAGTAVVYTYFDTHHVEVQAHDCLELANDETVV